MRDQQKYKKLNNKKNHYPSSEGPLDWMFCFMYYICKISSTEVELAKKNLKTLKLQKYETFNLHYI